METDTERLIRENAEFLAKPMIQLTWRGLAISIAVTVACAPIGYLLALVVNWADALK